VGVAHEDAAANDGDADGHVGDSVVMLGWWWIVRVRVRVVLFFLVMVVVVVVTPF
jgi:hypothetical protein